jgi:hypothetical protein
MGETGTTSVWNWKKKASAGASSFPDNGGYSLWVQAAFGDFWAVQESYWSCFSGVVDSALYPVLLYSSVSEIYEWLPSNLGGMDLHEEEGAGEGEGAGAGAGLEGIEGMERI